MSIAVAANKVGRIVALAIAWIWFVMAGLGGLALLIHEGPWPLTNGWFALFSGFSLCPGTAWLLKKYAGLNVPLWVQYAVALTIFVAGRAAVVVILHRPFLPHR